MFCYRYRLTKETATSAANPLWTIATVARSIVVTYFSMARGHSRGHTFEGLKVDCCFFFGITIPNRMVSCAAPSELPSKGEFSSVRYTSHSCECLQNDG